jgi:hypothetical protein
MNGRSDMAVSKPWRWQYDPFWDRSGAKFGHGQDDVEWVLATSRDIPTARQSLSSDPPPALAGSGTAATAAELIVLDAAGISNLGGSQIACRGGEITRSVNRIT